MSANNGGRPAGQPAAMIELRQVRKVFHNAAGEFVVLKGIDAAFFEHEFVSVVGRSGSGKSTLLNMMTGIDHPTSGTVRIGDAFLHTMNEGQMSVWRGRQMGIVFQFFQLLPMLTLLENVMLPMDFGDVYAPGEREDKAMRLLRMVGLEGFEHKYPAAVSGGQQQTAAVARALANDPPILVADEPTGNLDSRTAERVLEIFEEQVSRGKTIIMVTHDSGLARRAQRVLVISDGELINEGISDALPELSHAALLQLSHAGRVEQLAEGQELRPPAGGLVIVTCGAVEMLASTLARRQVAADVLHAGDALALPDSPRGVSGLRAVSAAEVLIVHPLPETAEMREALEALRGRNAADASRAGRKARERGRTA